METLKLFMTMLVPLVIIMDPIGNLPFFILFTKQNTSVERRRIAAIASLSACIILIFFGITGDFVLRFFGVGLPAFQIAGGFIFFVYALQLLRLVPGGMKTTIEEEEEGVAKENVALVPLATPLTAGPGAITAVLVWRQTPDNTVGSIALLLMVIIIACLIIYCVFCFAERICRFLGVGGIRVITRFMGLLLAVIAVQFIVNGFQQIL